MQSSQTYWRSACAIGRMSGNRSLSSRKVLLACPYFIPTHAMNGEWLHPSRLPLGAGWTGRCGAPGHDDAEPSSEDIRERCNLGYATDCARLPQERTCDSVRFSVARESNAQVRVWFVCEKAHAPAGHGILVYDLSTQQWSAPHSDPRIQRLAECYLQSYLLRRIQPAAAGDHASTLS